MNMTYEKLEPWSNKDNKLTILTGEKKLEPIKYHIVAKSVSYWWFFTKTEYSIESGLVTLDGFKSIEECMETLTKLRVGFRDIVLDV